MKQKLLLIALLLFIAGGIVFYFQWNKSHRDPSKEKGIPVNAEQLFAEYERNEQTANEKYLDKTIEVTGIIIDSGSNQAGEPTAMMDAGNPMFGVQITFNANQISKINNINIGDRITVKGICSGFLTDVIIKDAIILE